MTKFKKCGILWSRPQRAAVHIERDDLMKKTVCAVLSALIICTAVPAGAVPDLPGLVTASVLNVRKGAGKNTKKIGELKKNANVTILFSEGDWYKIQFGTEEAYVSSEYVSDDPDAIEAASRICAGEEIAEYAKSFIGIPYVYGGTTPEGFDCSGFVRYVFENFGIQLPRTTYEQLEAGASIDPSELEIGDLVFFRGGDHVGIYVGDGQYIHSPRTGRTVAVEPLDRTVYAARRIL